MYPAQNNCSSASPEMVGGAPEYYWKKYRPGMTAHPPTPPTLILTNPVAFVPRPHSRQSRTFPIGPPARVPPRTRDAGRPRPSSDQVPGPTCTDAANSPVVLGALTANSP